MRYLIDIDETICTTPEGDYAQAKPIIERIARINRLHDTGHEIVYWTSRGMGNGHDYEALTLEQLESWGAKYDELRLDKPIFDFHIDDKAIQAAEFFKIKSVAIVCAAAYLQGAKMGSEIDGHDLVVRVNLGYQMVGLYPHDLGTRTDVVYFCGSNWNNRQVHHNRIPKGAKIVKVNQAIPGAQNIARNYVANTGTRAAIDYAMKGYDVHVYGMDFYASANGGTIPIRPVSKNNKPLMVDRKKVYMDGYRGSNPKVPIGHIGGIRDMELILRYQKDYQITFDRYAQEVIKRNTLLLGINQG